MGCARFACMQPHYNPVYREEEREMLPLCVAEGTGVIPWSPLARGFLSGSRKRGEAKPKATARARSDDYAREMYFQDHDVDVLDAVLAIAKKRRVKPVQVALAWMLAKPVITAPILGTSRLEHIDDAVGALALRLDADEIAPLEAPYRPHLVLGM